MLLYYKEHQKAKAMIWVKTDAETRKLWEQIGLDTLVVIAVNDEH
jgi:hypothetical protein